MRDRNVTKTVHHRYVSGLDAFSLQKVIIFDPTFLERIFVERPDSHVLL